MPVELRIPTVGESVVEAQIATWLVQPGQRVERDQPVVVVETDKASVEIPAPVSGTLTKIAKPAGAKVKPGEVIGWMEEGAAASAPSAAAAPHARAAAATAPSAPAPARSTPQPLPPRAAPPQPSQPRPAPAASSASPPSAPPSSARPTAAPAANETEAPRVMPAASRLLAEHPLDPRSLNATGPGGRLLKEDVQRAIPGRPAAPPPQRAAPPPPSAPSRAEPPRPETTSRAEPPRREPAPRFEAPPEPPRSARPTPESDRATESVPMSPLRRTIARRLKEAQTTAALLTTFNEIDCSAVAALRREIGETFQKKHGVKLGLMSFFVKAAIDALAEVPAVNAQLRSSREGEPPDEIVYHHYCDIGIAVGGGKGLVVPVLRNAERLSFAEIERQIADFAQRAQENRLSLEELTGGTFTISNGGIYGSLLSTPIVNPPQSGVLGLHAIQERPVARDGQVMIRPMMYVALTYDHRLVDGREAVTFLKRVKECVEAPPRILLEA